MRKYGEPSARAGDRSPTRDRPAAQPGRRPIPRRSSAPDRERSPGVAQRRARHPHRGSRDAPADGTAGQRSGGIHAPRRTELARARRHAGAIGAVRPAVWPRSRAGIDPSGIDALAEGPNQLGAYAPRWRVPAYEPDADTGRGADRHLTADAGRRRPVRADAIESALDSAWVQSRERVALRAERAAGRVYGIPGRRLLRRPAAPPECDSRSSPSHAVA